MKKIVIYQTLTFLIFLITFPLIFIELPFRVSKYIERINIETLQPFHVEI